MQTIILEAETRENLTNGQLKDLRKSGWIPAVLYGGTKKKSSKKEDGLGLLKVPEKSFLKILNNHNAIVELKWGSQVEHVVIKEVQRDVVTEGCLHVDFQRINLTEKLELLVPIHFVGEAKGVKLSGGILQHMVRELKVLCLPKDAPSKIDIDVTHLDIGHGISVKDLKEISGVQILTDPNQLVANLVAPTILEEAPAVEAPTTAEPEVIAKGKKPEEEDGTTPAAAAPGKATPTPPAK